MAFHSFRDLTVWQKSMSLVTHLYKLTEKFPGEEKFGLTSQMRQLPYLQILQKDEDAELPRNIANFFKLLTDQAENWKHNWKFLCV